MSARIVIGLIIYVLGVLGILCFLKDKGVISETWLILGLFWPFAIPLAGAAWIVGAIIQISLGLYDALIYWRQTDRHKTPENDEHCCHEFFKCQVPAGDSCVAIYHQVCRKCRWDKRKGIFMPPDIWRGWALPQLEKLDNQ